MKWTLHPQKSVSQQELDSGLNMLLYDGICSQVMGVLTGGAFLVAFALQLNASNKVIGLIAAIGPFAQLLQIPAIFLVESSRTRKMLVVGSSILSRLFWFLIALTPFFLPASFHVPIFVACIFLYFGLGAISGLSFNSWMKDLIPGKIRGEYGGKRLAISTGVGAVLTLCAGLGTDYLKGTFSEISIYSSYFLVGGAFGLFGTFFLSRIPEPQMPYTTVKGLWKTLFEPFTDQNFRQLLIFLGSWNFVANLAAPFFTVYMLKRIGLSMSIIMALAVCSQIVNMMFFQLWGRLSDRYSNKSVLAVAGPLFMVSIFMWPFTTMPEKYIFTLPLLFTIHALAGMSSAGVMIATGNIALKLAPEGKSTAYLSINAVVTGCTATIAPIIGGFAADFFSGKELALVLTWKAALPSQFFELPAIHLRGYDFLFVISFLLSFYSMHRLLSVSEVGEEEKQVVLAEFYNEVRKSVKNISNVAGMRHLFYFPYARLIDVFGRRKNKEKTNVF